MTALTVALVGLIALAALWTMQASILRAVLGLALVSVLTTLLIFQMGAPLAGAFELSVCAGLITVVFASTVSMIRPAEPAEQHRRRTRQVLRFLFATGVLLSSGGVALFMHHLGVSRLAPPPPGAAELTTQEVLWSVRRLDLVGLLAIVLVGVFGVVVLFKEQPEREESAVSSAYWVQHLWMVVAASASLFAAGVGCVVFSRTLIRVLVGTELLVKSVTLLVVLAGAATGRVALAEALVVVLISLEVIGVAVAAGIVVGIHRQLGNANTDELPDLKAAQLKQGADR